MEGPEVPSFFICPISLQIMKDPVTISTGMTYDRDSIQKWLFCYNHKTCPVTKQALTNHILTPNSTLLRLIESWINNNPSRSPSMIHPPKPWPDISILLGKLSKEVREPELQIKSLRKIKSLIQESDHNRLFMEDTGIASLVASLITETDPQAMSQFSENSVLIEEATTVLYLLKPSRETLKKLCQDRKGLLITSLSLIIQRCYQARIHAALLLRSIFGAVDDSYKAELRMELFEGVAEILKDHNSNRATMAVLLILIEVMLLGKNRIKAVDAGIVSVLVELIAESSEKRSCEIMLGILEQLCGRAEGRSAFLAHPASVAAVATKIFRISHFANDKAVNVILSVCRFCKSSGVTKELLEVGGVAKLCMVVQSDCNMKTKERAKEILGLHLKEWKKSPCFPSYFIA